MSQVFLTTLRNGGFSFIYQGSERTSCCRFEKQVTEGLLSPSFPYVAQFSVRHPCSPQLFVTLRCLLLKPVAQKGRTEVQCILENRIITVCLEK